MRVVIAEASLLVRAGIVRLVEEAGFEVAAEAGDGDELLRKIRGHRPDVAVLGAEWVAAARTIREDVPSVGLLVLARHGDDPARLTALGAAGVGYLLRDRICEPGRLTDAIREVGRGGSVLDPQLVGRMVDRRRRADPFSGLTRREREVLAGMADGESNRGIARRLFVSERAVERHITAIFAKLAVPEDGHRRVLAVLAYLRAA
ncbi:MAG TPA: response regulator transcription factor [Solirubrobacter sp.]